MLIVIDEAHNVCPAEPAATPLTALATEQAVRIAAEGRKFGLYLLVSTQRPQKVHENVLSQCDNLVLMRMNSAADLAHLARRSRSRRDLLDQHRRSTQGEALVAGKFASHPALVRSALAVPRRAGWTSPPPGSTNSVSGMAKAYWINTFTAIHDSDKLAAYIELAGPAMRAAGGTFLARGNPAHAFESGTTERTTLIEFDSVDAAVAAYHSPAYQQALDAPAVMAPRGRSGSSRRSPSPAEPDSRGGRARARRVRPSGARPST